MTTTSIMTPQAFQAQLLMTAASAYVPTVPVGIRMLPELTTNPITYDAAGSTRAMPGMLLEMPHTPMEVDVRFGLHERLGLASNAPLVATKRTEAERRIRSDLPFHTFDQQLFAIQRAIDLEHSEILKASHGHSTARAYADSLKRTQTDDYFRHGINLLLGAMAMAGYGMRHTYTKMGEGEYALNGYAMTGEAASLAAAAATVFANTRYFPAAAMASEFSATECERYLSSHRSESNYYTGIKALFRQQLEKAGKSWAVSLDDYQSADSYLIKLFRGLFFLHGSYMPLLESKLHTIAADLHANDGNAIEAAHHNIRNALLLAPLAANGEYAAERKAIWHNIARSMQLATGHFRALESLDEQTVSQMEELEAAALQMRDSL